MFSCVPTYEPTDGDEVTRRRRTRRTKQRNPQDVLLAAQIAAAVQQGRNGTRGRLTAARAAYAARVVGTGTGM